MSGFFANKRTMFFSASVSAMLMLSLFIVAAFFRGESFVALHWLPTNKLALAIYLLIFGLAIAGGLNYFLIHFPGYLQNAKSGGGTMSKHIRFTKRSVATCALAIFLVWLPITILMYPAVSNLDFFNQIYQYQASAPTYYTTMGYVVDAEFIDHHPIFDTLVFGWFYTLGDALGSQNIGLFLLTICESFSLAFMLALTCCYAERLGLPAAVRLAFLLFAIFFPYYAPFAADSTKDTLFAIAFIPFVLCYFEIVRSRGEVLKNRKFTVALIVVTGLCILTKKLGVYICIPSLLVLLVPYKQVRLRLVAVTACIFLLFSFLVPQILYAAYDVAPGGKQEMLFIPLQQTVALMKEFPEAYSNSEKECIDKVIDLNRALKRYDRTIADPVKNSFRHNATNSDISDYLFLWARKGLQHPVLYVKATLMCSARLILPSSSMGFDVDIANEDIRQRWSKHFSETSDGFDFNAQRPEVLLDLSSRLKKLLSVKIASIPVVGLFTTRGMYGGWIPFVCIAITFFNRKSECFALVPIILSVCLLLISPGSLARYVHSLMFVIIPMLAWMFHSFHLRHFTM